MLTQSTAGSYRNGPRRRVLQAAAHGSLFREPDGSDREAATYRKANLITAALVERGLIRLGTVPDADGRRYWWITDDGRAVLGGAT